MNTPTLTKIRELLSDPNHNTLYKYDTAASYIKEFCLDDKNPHTAEILAVFTEAGPLRSIDRAQFHFAKARAIADKAPSASATPTPTESPKNLQEARTIIDGLKTALAAKPAATATASVKPAVVTASPAASTASKPAVSNTAQYLAAIDRAASGGYATGKQAEAALASIEEAAGKLSAEESQAPGIRGLLAFSERVTGLRDGGRSVSPQSAISMIFTYKTANVHTSKK